MANGSVANFRFLSKVNDATAYNGLGKDGDCKGLLSVFFVVKSLLVDCSRQQQFMNYDHKTMRVAINSQIRANFSRTIYIYLRDN